MNRFLFFFFILFFSIISYGQNDSVLIDSIQVKAIIKWEIGIEDGVNNTYLINKDPYYHYTWELGPAAGIAFQRNFSPHFAIRFGVQYQKRTLLESFGSVKRKYVSDMICVPLTIRSYFGKKRIIFLDHGLRFDHCYRERRTIEGYTGFSESKRLRTDMNILLGLGTRINLSERFDFNISLNGAIEFNSAVFNKKYYSNGNSLYPNIFQTDALIGINYKFKSKNATKKTKQNDSAHVRKTFVKIFYSAQMTGNTMRGDHVVLQDAYYGNSHKHYYYDGNLEVAQEGQEFGIFLEIRKRKNFNLNIGLTVDQLRFQTKEVTLYYSGWGDILGNFSGSYKNTKLQYKFDFFTIPLIANFVHNAKKCSFYVGAGIGLKKLYHSNVTFETRYGKVSFDYKLGNKTSTNKIDILNLFTIANIGMNIPFSKSVSIFIEPNFKYDLGKFNIPINDRPVQLWSAGCKVGLKF